MLHYSRSSSRRRRARHKHTRKRTQRGGTNSTGPTFHILIASGGRPSLKGLLASLKDELSERDALTIVFDGKDKKAASGWSNDWIKGFKAPVAVLEEKDNKGHWGHPIRQAYSEKLQPQTTFIMHADDDDEYIPGFMYGLRQTCTDPTKLYVARMLHKSNPRNVIPRQFEYIKQADIGNPCGIIPWADASRGTWGNDYLGDFKYYDTLSKVIGMGRVSFIPNIIYVVSK